MLKKNLGTVKLITSVINKTKKNIYKFPTSAYVCQCIHFSKNIFFENFQCLIESLVCIVSKL